MIVHPELRALRGDDSPQRHAQERCLEALADWRTIPQVMDVMADLSAFLKAIEDFVMRLDAAGLRDAVPLAIECRNANYLKREYFQFLKDHGIAHVFSEKLYLPHIYELYAQFGDLIGDRVAIRLLGGDRKEIEDKTKGNWNEIVEPKADLPEVASMIGDLAKGSKIVKVYLNNHYEGSAPKSIERLEALLS